MMDCFRNKESTGRKRERERVFKTEVKEGRYVLGL
jgi:hypothetical protein